MYSPALSGPPHKCRQVCKVLFALYSLTLIRTLEIVQFYTHVRLVHRLEAMQQVDGLADSHARDPYPYLQLPMPVIRTGYETVPMPRLLTYLTPFPL